MHIAVSILSRITKIPRMIVSFILLLTLQAQGGQTFYGRHLDFARVIDEAAQPSY
jgi:hypothetical protein